MLDLESQDLYHIFDEGLAVVSGDKDSWKDSIGRTVLMWIAYNQDSRLEVGLESCIQYEDPHWVLYRHPRVIDVEDYKNDMSKDHWSYFLMYRRLRDNDKDFEEFLEDVPLKLGLRLWASALTGNEEDAESYYFWQIIGAWLGNGWNKFWRGVGDIGDEYSNADWDKLGHIVQNNLSIRQRIFRKFLIPNYPLHNKAWQLYVLPDHPMKEQLKKLLLKRVMNRKGCSNYLLRILFGDKTVTEQEVNGYMHMTGYRWGTNLDETCRRDVKVLSQYLVRANGYEKDILLFAYNNQN
jgi:hypothetical protein